jgi:hypothetical protein
MKNETQNELGNLPFALLAWWHNYKWATEEEIVKVFSSDFLAPWFHHLWPEREFDSAKISHPARTTYLSYIRLYPRFRVLLDKRSQLRRTESKTAYNVYHLKDMCGSSLP